jgi:hypothetical protein
MTDPTPDPARPRFFMLQAARLAGVVAAAVGVLMWQTDRIGGASDPDTGKALFALGLFLVLVAPALLRKRWRSEGDAAPRGPRQ